MSRRGIIRFSSLLLLLLSVGCAPTLPGPSGKIVKNYAGIRTAEAVGPGGEEYRKTVAQMDPYLARLFLGANDFDLVDGIFGRITNIASDSDIRSLARLPKPQRVVFDIWGGGGLIGNGGFPYLFTSDVADFASIAESYDVIGAPESAQAVRDALALFPNSQPHADINERLPYLKSLGADGKQRLEACGDAIFDGNRATKRKLAAYVRANAAAFVSLPSNKWEKLEELERKDLPAPHANISDEAFELWLRSIDAGASIEGYSQIVPQTKSKVFASEFKVSSRRLSLSEYRSSTDAELEILAGLEPRKTIHSLSLTRTRITRKGIVFIPQFPELTSLDLSGTDAEDGWCAELSKLPKLEQLGLARTRVTDAGLKHLTSLPSLKGLGLSNSSVKGTEELGQLAELKSLRTLSLPKGTEDSPGVRILRERRPELEISFD